MRKRDTMNAFTAYEPEAQDLRALAGSAAARRR
jgi:hypothetical protein